MSETSSALFQGGFAAVDPIFGAFAAVANFIGSKPSQSRSDRSIGSALARELPKIGVPLWPVKGKGKGGGSPWRSYERGLEALQARESPAYLAALAEGQRLGFSPDTPILNRETFRDSTFGIINEFYTLAVGAASLQGLAFPTPEELFPRIGSSRTSGDWLSLGIGLAPLALDKLAPVDAGKLDVDRALAGGIPEITVAVPAPVIWPAVREVVRRAIPAAAGAARARARRRRPIREPEQPLTGPPGPGAPAPAMPPQPEFFPEVPPAIGPEALPLPAPAFVPQFVPEVIVTSTRQAPRVASLLSPGLQTLAALQLGTVQAPRLSPQLRASTRPAQAPRGRPTAGSAASSLAGALRWLTRPGIGTPPGFSFTPGMNPLQGFAEALAPGANPQTSECRVVCRGDKGTRPKKKGKKSRRCFKNPASLAAHTKRAVERALSRISP